MMNICGKFHRNPSTE